MKLKTAKTLVVSIPRLEPHRPPVGPAIIANCIKQAGFPVDAVDLNIKFFRYLNDNKMYYAFDQAFDGIRSLTLSEYKNIIRFLSMHYKPTVVNVDFVAISVFGPGSRLFSHILCRYTRKHFSTVKIILGGTGVSGINDDKKHFGQHMLEQQLCDFYIMGDGEKSIVKLLEGNITYPGINNDKYEQLIELDSLPWPDYSFYNLDEYDYLEDNKEVFVVASRGCVRHCTYCTIQRYWPKFKFRSGDNIANELISHYEKHGIRNFYFADSLINGSQTAFYDMCKILARYNQQHDAGFNWNAQFIFKRKHQISNEYFDIMAEAGAKRLYVGIETGSDKIRWEMDKKFTNDDITYHLENFNRTGMSVFFLMLTGYLTETLEDHQETLDMFSRWQYYVATGTIAGIDIGTTLIINKVLQWQQ